MKILLVSEGASELRGALENLVRRIGLQDDVEIEHEKVSKRELRAHHGKGKGYFKRAVRWMMDAEKRGYDGLILLIDEDGNAERVKEIAQAQDDVSVTVVRRALGVAIRTFDAWMLADETALRRVLECEISRQPDPETLNHPKQRCGDLLKQSAVDLAPSSFYAALAAVIDIGNLEKRCEKGFARFAKRVRAMNS